MRLALGTSLRYPLWQRAVVLPVDHPLVSSDTVRALLAVDAPAVIPRRAGKRGHPVIIAREAAERIVAGALAGPTLREVLHSLAAVDVAVGDPGVNANCNTPEALAAAWRQLSGG
jgi:molybdenum cofactor cytidylyltransferase